MQIEVTFAVEMSCAHMLEEAVQAFLKELQVHGDNYEEVTESICPKVLIHVHTDSYTGRSGAWLIEREE